MNRFYFIPVQFINIIEPGPSSTEKTESTAFLKMFLATMMAKNIMKKKVDLTLGYTRALSKKLIQIFSLELPSFAKIAAENWLPRKLLSHQNGAKALNG